MSDSFYDQFGGGDSPVIEQPPIEQKPRERTAGQFANRADMSKPYVNKAPDHSAHYDRKEQANESKGAYWRMHTKQIPKGEFEQSVNNRFGGKDEIGEDYRGKMPSYVALYKKMMEQWNNQ